MENKHITEVKHGGKTLALIFSKKIKAGEKGINFLTPLDYPLQIGLLEHKNGRNVPFHIHRDFKYKVNTTQEFLYIEKGRADISVSDKKWNVVKTATLRAGDFVLFVSGGHKVDIHKGSRIIEIKQGPYPGDAKAKIFKEPRPVTK